MLNPAEGYLTRMKKKNPGHRMLIKTQNSLRKETNVLYLTFPQIFLA